MDKKKIFYGIIIILFLGWLNFSHLITGGNLKINCSSIQQQDVFQKKLNMPHLRTVDVLKITTSEKVIFVQSNDKNLVREISQEIKKCSSFYTVDYYNYKNENGKLTYFIGNSFFE